MNVSGSNPSSKQEVKEEKSDVGAAFAILALFACLVISLVALAVQFYMKSMLKKKLSILEKNKGGRTTKGGVANGSTESVSVISASVSETSTVKTVSKRKKPTSKKSPASKKEKKENKDKKSEKSGSSEKVVASAKVGGEKEFLGMSPTMFGSSLKSVGAFIADFADHPEQYPVSPDAMPGFIYNSFPSHAPVDPTPFNEVMNDFKEVVFPGMGFFSHPGFLAYFPMGRSFPDMLAEMINSTMGIPCSDWASSGAFNELEVLMVNWMGRAIGLPESFLFQGNSESSPGGGSFAESASECIFLAVTAARTRKIDQLMRSNGDLLADDEHFLVCDKSKKRLDRQHELCAKLTVYTNTEAHSCIEKACQMAIVGHRPLQGQKDADYGMTGKQLEEAIKKDVAAGFIPCMVHCTLGTTSSCAFDRVEEIVAVARKYDMWVHVDSAYAGGSWVEPALRGPMAGLEGVNSINSNPHKLLLHSNSGSLIWTRDQKTFRAAMRDYSSKGNKFGANTDGWTTHGTRRSKALKTWFILRLYGMEGLRDRINRLCEMTEYFRQLMSSYPNARLWGERKLALFSFQYFEKGMSEDDINYHTKRLNTYFNESHKVMISHSNVDGNDIVRVSVCYENMNKQDVEMVWGDMKALIDTYKERKNDPTLVQFPPTPSKPKQTGTPKSESSDQKTTSPIPSSASQKSPKKAPAPSKKC